MTPFHEDDWLTIYSGDCREVLAALPAEWVNCVVTSPPYWGLRDYGGATGQLGMEQTAQEYVENMVEVFRQVRRVLRSDGTLWLNLGDSYGSGSRKTQEAQSVANGDRRDLPVARGKQGWEKQLIGIPWRVAFALQEDGWILRSDIVWSKPNPMPESVSDRPTKSHEYMFLFAKSLRYYFDGDAVKEPQSDWTFARGHVTASANGVGDGTKAGLARGIKPNPLGRNIRSVWTIPTQAYPGEHFAVFPPKLVEPCIKAGCPPRGVVLDPFAGSGTTGFVAQNLSRKAVLIDVNPEYMNQQLIRNSAVPLGLS